MKVTKNDVGRFCTVKFDDTGLAEGILVEVNDNVRVFIPDSGVTRIDDLSQIRQIGSYINFVDSGL